MRSLRGAEQENKDRVFITGIGVVSPIGIGKSSFLEGLREGRSGIGKISQFDPYRLSSQIAGEVLDFSFQGVVPPKRARRMDRATRFALTAVKEALQDACLSSEEMGSRRAAIVVGTALGGGVIPGLRFHDRLKECGPERATPYFTIFSIDVCASYIAVEFGIRGVNLTVSNGCSSSATAIGVAFDLLRQGRADLVIVCGTETPIHETIMAPFCTSRVLSTRNDCPEQASRPFDRQRDGFVMAEGAGAIILEREVSALSRKAPIYAELAGYAMTCDPYSVSSTAPTPREMVRSMREALMASDLSPNEVDYLNAYANGLPHLDRLEATAIAEVFGSHVQRLPVTSTKSQLGHPLGASAILEVIATLLAMKEGFVPPSINCEEPDPDCPL